MELHPAIIHFPSASTLAAALIGMNGYLGERMDFTEGVGVRATEVRRPPVEDNAGKGGPSRENGKIPKGDSRAEVDD